MKFHLDNCYIVHRGKCTQNTYMLKVPKSLAFSEEPDLGITVGSSLKKWIILAYLTQLGALKINFRAL